MQNPMITWTVVGERMTQKKGIIPFLQTSHPLGFGFHLKGSPPATSCLGFGLVDISIPQWVFTLFSAMVLPSIPAENQRT